LVRVVSQIAFPLIASIGQAEYIGPFQEAIRDTYPVLRPDQTQGVVMGPEGAVSTTSERLWRFADSDGHWRATLAPTFVALESTAYTNRDDFLGRLARLLTAADEHIAPKVVDRLGLRYIDRVREPEFADIPRLFRREMLGLAGTDAWQHVELSLNQTRFSLPAASVTATWGQLPVMGTHDPNAVEPIEQPSWILDLDMFTRQQFEFNVDQITDKCRSFAERIYAIFRWAVTDEFLRRYGGEP
jgi:uncharacterized protein (TIGR04255 family)